MQNPHTADFDKAFDGIDKLVDQWKEEKLNALACLTALSYYVELVLRELPSEIADQYALEIANYKSKLREADNPERLELKVIEQRPCKKEMRELRMRQFNALT